MKKREEQIEALSRKLEVLKDEHYECPGPTRDVDDSVKDAIERFLADSTRMSYLDCIAANCCACERFDKQDANVAEVEDSLDTLMEADGASDEDAAATTISS